MTDVIRLEIERGLATITLDRPKAANAVNGEMKSQLLEALLQVHADAEVRAVLILAEGKNFCVGQDLGEHAAALDADPAHAMDTVEAHYNPIVTALSTLSVPVVVGIGGAASGPVGNRVGRRHPCRGGSRELCDGIHRHRSGQ